MRVKIIAAVLAACAAQTRALESARTGMLDPHACALIRGSVFANSMCGGYGAGNAKQTWMFGQNIPQAQRRMDNMAFLHPSGIIGANRTMNTMNNTANMANKPCITGLVLVGGVCYPTSMILNNNTNMLLSKMSAAARESVEASKLAVLHASIAQKSVLPTTALPENTQRSTQDSKTLQDGKTAEDTDHTNVVHVNIHTGQNNTADKSTAHSTYKQPDSTKSIVITIGSTDKKGNVVNDVVTRTVQDNDTTPHTSIQDRIPSKKDIHNSTSTKTITTMHSVHIDDEHNESSDDRSSDNAKTVMHTAHNKDNNDVTDKAITQKVKQILAALCKDTEQCGIRTKTKHKQAHRRHKSTKHHKNKNKRHTDTDDRSSSTSSSASSDASSTSDTIYTTPRKSMHETQHNVILYPSAPKYRSRQKSHKRHIPYRNTLQRVHHVQPELIDDVSTTEQYYSIEPTYREQTRTPIFFSPLDTLSSTETVPEPETQPVQYTNINVVPGRSTTPRSTDTRSAHSIVSHSIPTYTKRTTPRNVIYMRASRLLNTNTDRYQ